MFSHALSKVRSLVWLVLLARRCSRWDLTECPQAMNENRHSYCCLDVHTLSYACFFYVAFLTNGFGCVSLTNDRTRSETSFEIVGIMLKPLAFEFSFPLPPSLLKWGVEGVVVVGLGSLLARGIFLRCPFWFVLALELDRLIAFFGAWSRSSERAALPNVRFCNVRCSQQIKHNNISICRSSCTHIIDILVFDCPSSFPEVLLPDRYYYCW